MATSIVAGSHNPFQMADVPLQECATATKGDRLNILHQSEDIPDTLPYSRSSMPGEADVPSSSCN